MSDAKSKKDVERAEAARRKAAALRANLKRRKVAKRRGVDENKASGDGQKS